MKTRVLASLLSAVSICAMIAAPAFAEKITMNATLDGAQQVPPVESPGKGTAQVTFDTDTKMLEWTVEYSGLPEAPSAGHFHGPADKGANAGVAVPFEGALTSPIKGSATLTDAQAADLQGGQILHQPAHRRAPRRRDPRPGREGDVAYRQCPKPAARTHRCRPLRQARAHHIPLTRMSFARSIPLSPQDSPQQLGQE